MERELSKRISAALLYLSWVVWIPIDATTAHAAVEIDWVTVGDAGNEADPASGSLYGAVEYEYRISKFEVRNVEYLDFLNAVAETDTHALYATTMGSSLGGITRNGSSGSYTYSAVPGRENMPVNGVSFWSATRFANWLHNGRPTGAQNSATTEDGAYTLTPTAIATNTVTRNADAKFFVPSENEWYKAAYYKRGGTQAGYWTYPVESTPENWPHPPAEVMMICSTPTTVPSRANCAWKISDFSAVGSYTGAPSASGTFDQGGNAWEWIEAIIADENRTLRGGSFVSPSSGIGTQIRHRELPSLQAGYVGFRIASLAPVSVPALNPFGVATLCTLLGLAGRRGLRR